jgi:hypothetical protein
MEIIWMVAKDVNPPRLQQIITRPPSSCMRASSDLVLFLVNSFLFFFTLPPFLSNLSCASTSWFRTVEAYREWYMGIPNKGGIAKSGS